MRSRTWIVLVLALASGLIAGYAALQLVSSRPTQSAPEEPRSAFQLVVAARDLPVGSLLGEEDVRLMSWPGELVPEGYAQQIQDVIGRGLILPVKLNEPILLTKLAGRGLGGGFRITIPEGMRAVGVPVDEIMTIAGFVAAGSRVDVLLTTQPPGSSEMITKTVETLQNLEVGSVGPNYQLDPQGNPVPGPMIALFVTPEQAEEITLARNRGQIQFTLRNQLDVKEIRTQGARLGRMLALSGGGGGGSQTRSTPQPTRETGSTVEIIKGGQRSILRFGNSGGNGADRNQ